MVAVLTDQDTSLLLFREKLFLKFFVEKVFVIRHISDQDTSRRLS